MVNSLILVMASKTQVKSTRWRRKEERKKEKTNNEATKLAKIETEIRNPKKKEGAFFRFSFQ